MPSAGLANVSGERSLPQVLDQGAVELINFMGGDQAVVAAARVSNGKLYEEASKGEDSDRKLIRFLLKNRHTSPFEHSLFTFYVKAPLFVRSEWQRHRTWSYNEISGRYTEFDEEFYIPRVARSPHPTNKQASIESNDEILDYVVWSQISRNSQEAYRLYTKLMENGIAREMARLVLPVNLYTQFYGTVNAHNLMKFITLRSSEDAQWEIRQYAKVLSGMLAEKMPLTFAAYEESSGLADR